MKDKGPWCRSRQLNQLVAVSADEVEFLPSGGTCAPQIKATHRMLLHRGSRERVEMKATILAYSDPTPPSNFGQPLIIRRIMREIAIGAMMVFDNEWRTGQGQRFGKACSKISIKEEC